MSMVGMNRWRKMPGGLLLLATLLVAAGCGSGSQALPGEAELEGLPADPEKTTVLEALPFGPLEGEGRSLLWGYRRSTYLVDGSTVEVLWVGPAAGAAPAAPVRGTYNPVMFRNDQLDGWGWTHFDERREAWGLPDPDAPPAESGPDGGTESGPESGAAPAIQGA